MLRRMCTVVCLITIGIVTIETLCPKRCQCKAFGYCYDCEKGSYLEKGECKKCVVNCLDCSSEKICEKCDIGHYLQSDKSCNACSQGCKSCLTYNHCLECDAGYFKSDRKCFVCSSKCKTCSSRNVCLTCSDGFVLNNTSCQSCPDNCKNCTALNECATCKEGFFGKSCDQECSTGCKDEQCEQNSGQCTCKKGYIGSLCNHCTAGKYGPHCNLDCPKECLTCDINGNCIACYTGYYGIKCNCSNGCLDNKCDKWSGSCYQCKPFFKWPCLKCVDGKYGKNCEHDCPVNCLSCSSEVKCDKCIDGYNGTACDEIFQDGKFYKICRPGLYGKVCEFECDRKCKTCNSASEKIRTCLICKDGRYGNNNASSEFYHCNQKCPANCRYISCNADSGVCDFGCKHGYWGQFCEKHCSNNCLKYACHQVTGICSLGCSEGYHGKMCDCPKNCICNTSGQCLLGCLNVIGEEPCDRSCNSECLHCDQDYRRCNQCVNHNFYGPYCDQECRPTCNGHTCDSVTGWCKSGCQAGYFGNKCDQRCDRNCLKCHRENGSCDIVTTERGNIVTKSANSEILLTFVAVFFVYSLSITIVLIRQRYKGLHYRVTNHPGSNIDNNYEPVARSRSVPDTDHMYTMLAESSEGNPPLMTIGDEERRRRNDSTSDSDMYIHPIHTDTRTSHKYETVL